jgi:beta-lactamase class A
VKVTRRDLLATIPIVCARAADPQLAEWRHIAAQTDGVVGAASLDLESGRRVSLNGMERFPLASVCKLPIAAAVLAMVEEGKLRLDEELEIPPYDVVPTVSPIAERWPKQRRFQLEEMIELMIAQSDNTAVQTLFRVAGGASGMAARFQQWGIVGMRVDRNERECGMTAAGVRAIPPMEEWTPDLETRLEGAITPRERIAALRRFLADPRDTGSPDSTIDLIRKLYRGELLSRSLTSRLIQMMERTTTGPGRIKGLLAPGTVVAHKTGTTGSAGSLNGSTNDVGVVAGRIALAVYVKGSTRPIAVRERVIAEMARSVVPA